MGKTMAGLMKWVGIVVGGLILLIHVVLLLIPRLVDFNRYKSKVEHVVAESTGRKDTSIRTFSGERGERSRGKRPCRK
jgi:hypothetical protein